MLQFVTRWEQRKDSQFDTAAAQFDEFIGDECFREFGKDLKDVCDAARRDHRTTRLHGTWRRGRYEPIDSLGSSLLGGVWVAFRRFEVSGPTLRDERHYDPR